MFMKSVMIKTKMLTKQVQSVNINIVDTLQSAKVTISTLHHLRDDEQNLNNLITAVVEFSERHGVDANGEYQRQHRHIFQCESTTSHHRRGRVPTFSLERFGTRSERECSVRLITLFWKFKCEVSNDFFSQKIQHFFKILESKF